MVKKPQKFEREFLEDKDLHLYEVLMFQSNNTSDEILP